MQKGRFDQRRTGQGYKAPAERDGCRNCRYCSWAPRGFGEGTYSCKLGGFFVSPRGICDHHQPAGIASLPASPELPT